MHSRMNIYTLGTHSDWFYSGGAWGVPGHQRIVDLCKAAGISRLYWRTHNGGQAAYPSKKCRIQDGSFFTRAGFQGVGTLPRSYFQYARHVDYRGWDQLADMLETGAGSDLEVSFWYTFLEDDHGGPVPSAFLEAHPELRCTTREGNQIDGCLEFWYPEVREYKLAIVDELLERPVKRLLLDVLRRNGKPSADAAGNYRYGFNPEVTTAFRKETGVDALAIHPGSPEWDLWLTFHSRSLNGFIREVAARAAARGVAVDLLTWAVPTKEWLALDLADLVGSGAVDLVFTGTLRYAFSASDARFQVATVGSSVPELRADRVVPGLFGYHHFAPRSVDDFLGAARESGCTSVCLHESNYMVSSPITDRLRAWSYGKPHQDRTVKSSRTSESEYCGFTVCHDVTGRSCDQITRFSLFHDDTSLRVRVYCSERSPEHLLPVPELERENFNAVALGARAFWNPFESVHVFLDAAHQHEDFFHFVLDPSGRKLADMRRDENWDQPWEGHSQMGSDGWTATFVIPWASLAMQPNPGVEMGFQVFRVQNRPREVSSWFCSTGRRIQPEEFGHLVLR